MKYKKSVGIALISLGVFLIIIQPFSMTGAVIDISTNIAKIWFGIGLVLIAAGAGFIYLIKSPNLETISNAGISLIHTEQFVKAIKNAPLEQINHALKKIGTGLGKEHGLTTGKEAIRTSKGGRILFDYNPSQNLATIHDYMSDHDYKRHLKRR